MIKQRNLKNTYIIEYIIRVKSKKRIKIFAACRTPRNNWRKLWLNSNKKISQISGLSSSRRIIESALYLLLYFKNQLICKDLKMLTSFIYKIKDKCWTEAIENWSHRFVLRIQSILFLKNFSKSSSECTFFRFSHFRKSFAFQSFSISLNRRFWLAIMLTHWNVSRSFFWMSRAWSFTKIYKAAFVCLKLSFSSFLL